MGYLARLWRNWGSALQRMRNTIGEPVYIRSTNSLVCGCTCVKTVVPPWLQCRLT